MMPSDLTNGFTVAEDLGPLRMGLTAQEGFTFFSSSLKAFTSPDEFKELTFAVSSFLITEIPATFDESFLESTLARLTFVPILNSFAFRSSRQSLSSEYLSSFRFL